MIWFIPTTQEPHCKFLRVLGAGTLHFWLSGEKSFFGYGWIRLQPGGTMNLFSEWKSAIPKHPCLHIWFYIDSLSNLWKSDQLHHSHHPLWFEFDLIWSDLNSFVWKLPIFTLICRVLTWFNFCQHCHQCSYIFTNFIMIIIMIFTITIITDKRISATSGDFLCVRLLSMIISNL